MAKREISEINAGSMADIAFLLLIFFLVTTTMDTDTGLMGKLPPIIDDVTPPPKLKERNIFEVLVNANDQLLVEGKYIEISQLREKAVEFVRSNPNFPNVNDKTNASYPDLPEFEIKEVPLFGDVLVSKQIVSLQNDMGTSYKMYITVRNELMAAYNIVRNELSNQKFNMSYADLVKQAKATGATEEIKTKYKAIRKLCPQRISEAEPKKVGGPG